MVGDIKKFYGPKSWIEGASEKQLEEVAKLDGVTSVSAFPDLHPGKNGPVGVAVSSQRLYPHLVGNDLGCGFSLFELNLSVRKLRVDNVVERLRAIDFDNTDGNADRLVEAGLSDAPFWEALGSIGGGNHFAELTSYESSYGSDQVNHDGVLLFVHSGSRSFGNQVWENYLAKAEHAHNGLEASSENGRHWLSEQERCVRWASLNRLLVAERIASALRGGDVTLLCDVPHNLVSSVVGNDGFLHFKGASFVTPGALCPVAGSRDSLSYLVKGLDTAKSNFGIAHGSGRKRDRSSMHSKGGLKRSEREAFQRNQWGGRVICDDPNMLVEEQASAYKNSKHVIEELGLHDLVEVVSPLKPLVTYKRVISAEVHSSKAKDKSKFERQRHARG